MKRVFTVLALLIVVLLAGAGGYLYSKQPTRQGQIELRNLQGSVTVRYDERGVPHIRAENETDLYRALGYVHAQDRLFQMEAMRRLARANWPKCSGRNCSTPTNCSAACAFASAPPLMWRSWTTSRRTGRPCKPIWTGSTNIRTATPAPWSSTC